MARVHFVVVFIGLSAFGPWNAAASAAGGPDEAALLREELAAQRTLNQQLLQRLEALEAGQGALLEKVRLLEDRAPSEQGEAGESREALEEVRHGYFEMQEALDRAPNLAGYYDFEYINDDRKNSPGEFRQHRLTLLLTKELPKYRFFGEVEFEYGAKFEGEGGTELEESTGEVKLEEVWGEYIHSDSLTLRAGKIFVPSYVSIHHWPNLWLSTRYPLMRNKVFPDTFVGVMAYGSKYWEKLGVTYKGYVANGVSEFEAKEDTNENKAVGGQLTFHLPSHGLLDTFDVAVSGYMESPPDAERTQTWGLESQIRKGKWEVLTELALRGGEESRTGFYLQPSYRFNERWATFYRYDFLDVDPDFWDVNPVGKKQEHTIGVNYRPITDVSLKLEYFYSSQSEDGDFSGVAASVAIRF
jgi:hypothetical protein